METTYTVILDRMKLAGRLKNNSAVARAIGMTPQAISNYKKRGKFPSSVIFKFADIYDVSIDWLLTGKGEAPSVPIKNAVRPRGIKDFGKITAMSPDELVCVGKLLKILRTNNGAIATAAKLCIDSLLKAACM